MKIENHYRSTRKQKKKGRFYFISHRRGKIKRFYSTILTYDLVAIAQKFNSKIFYVILLCPRAIFILNEKFTQAHAVSFKRASGTSREKKHRVALTKHEKLNVDFSILSPHQHLAIFCM